MLGAAAGTDSLHDALDVPVAVASLDMNAAAGVVRGKQHRRLPAATFPAEQDALRRNGAAWQRGLPSLGHRVLPPYGLANQDRTYVLFESMEVVVCCQVQATHVTPDLRRRPVSVLTTKRTRRVLLAELVALAAAPVAGIRPEAAAAQRGGVTPDGRVYAAYVPAATKVRQFYQYSCEFDASWVVLATFGKDVSFEEQLDIVGHDTSLEPYFEKTAEGVIIYGGDITSAFCGDYTSNMLARSTGTAFLPLFEHYGLEAETVKTREEIEAILDRGGLVWTKATVDFLPW